MKEGVLKSKAWIIGFSVVSLLIVFLVLFPASRIYSLTAVISTAKELLGIDSRYYLGETVVLHGEVGLSQGELKSLSSVALDVVRDDSVRFLRVNLPLTPGLNQDLTNLLPTDDTGSPLGSLFADVIAENLIERLGYGYGYGYGYDAFEGGYGGGRLKYVIRWTPPLFLYPRPVFSLIPAFEEIATIPTLETPPGPDPSTVLPNTVKKFDIPALGAPTGTVLPSADLVGNIPQLSIPSTAPAEVPNLPDTTVGFDIPTVPVPAPPAGVPELPDTTPAIDIPAYPVETAPAGVPDLPDTAPAFDIPTLPGLTGPVGVPNLPDSALAFDIPGDAMPRGLAFDGTDFWMVIDGPLSTDPDRVIKLNSSGTQIGSAIIGPSNNLDGIAYLNGYLWVIENQWRCWDYLDGSYVETGCNRYHRIFRISPSSPPSNALGWFDTVIDVPDDRWAYMGGLTAQGSGGTGTLWVARKDYGRLFNIEQNGNAIASYYTSEYIDAMNSVAFYNGFLYTTKGNKITRWTTTAVKSKDFTTEPSRANIQGMTFDASTGVLYLAGGTDKKVYKSFVEVTVTTDPRGIAFQQSGSDKFLWLLVDGDPIDKLMKINASDGTLVTAFGTGGAVDAPSALTEGVAFFNNYLWIIANEGSTRRLFKVNPENGTVVTTYDLGTTASIWADLGDITTDGTNLVVYEKGSNTLYVLSPTDATKLDTKWPCCPSVAGAHALAFNSARQQLLFARSGKLSYLNPDLTFDKEQSLTVDGTSISGVQGMAFDGAVLYVARSGKVSKGALLVKVTTNPRGIAFQQDGSTKVLWILVDGEPKDKLLKVDAGNGTLITAFGTGGAVDVPSAKSEGIAFDGTRLWIVVNEGDGRKLLKVRASDGVVLATLNLSVWPGGFVYEDVGGLEWDGTNLVLFASGSTHLWVVNNLGEKVDEKYPYGPSFYGATGLAFHSGRNQLYAAKSGKLATFDSSFNFVRERSLTVDETSITGVHGLAFDGDVLYVARAGKVSKGAIITTVTTAPRGIAFSPAGSTPGKALWIVVDGDPNDKLMKVDADSGLLVSAFGTSGAVDLPGNNAQGVAFLSNKLWVVVNDADGRKLIRLKSTDGTVEQTFNLSVWPGGFVWEDVGDITTDGTNLIVYALSSNRSWTIDTSGEKVEEKYPCCPSFTGAKGLAYHSGRAQFFAGSGGKLVAFDSAFLFIKEQTLTVDSNALTGLQGLVFAEDVLYVARPGKVSKGALRDIATTNPRGVAFTPEGTVILGTPVGKALWVLVDGDPKDKLLKLDADTLALLTDFSDDGAIDAPSGNTEGITFLSNALWIIANDPDGRKLFKVRPTDGAIQETFNLSGTGGFVWDDVGGITTDGTNLLIYTLGQDRLFTVNTVGGKEEEKWMPYELNGAKGLAFRSAKNQLFSAKSNKVIQLVKKDSDYFRADLFTTALTDIQGMTFADDVLFMAHSGSGQVSKASIPSEISNSPRGLTYDGTNLYILVDGKGRDHIIVVNPTSGALVRDFPAPDEDAEAITYVGGSLYVAINDDDPWCCTKSIKKLNPNNGTELASFGQPYDFWDGVTGMSNDGDNLIETQASGAFVVFQDPDDGSRVEARYFFAPPGEPIPEGFQALAYDRARKHFWTAFGKKVFRFDEFGGKIGGFTITTAGVDSIRGATFVSGLLYLAEASGKTIQSAGIPTPPTVITNEPRAMATDGSGLYVAVNASPRDKILHLTTLGALHHSFDSVGNETDGLAYLTLSGTGYLYALINDKVRDPGGFEVVRPRIAKMNPTTGEKLAMFPIRDSMGHPLMEQMGGLASDGLYLFATSKETGNVFRIDPANPGASALVINQFAGILPFLPDLESAEIAMTRLVVSGAPVVGGIANNIARLDKATGVMMDQFNLGNVNIRGSAYIGINLYMADALSGKLLATILPEQTPELTVVGIYDSKLIVRHNPGTVESPISRFAIEKNPEVKARITSPAAGFVTANSNFTVRGQVNDYSLIRSPFNKVRVRVELPFTTLFVDNVARPGSSDLWVSSGLWHIACQGDSFQPKVADPTCAWRYGRQGQPNFDTGAPNAGEITLKNPIMVGPDTGLNFSIWYDTEPSSDKDKKTLLIAEVTKDAQGNDVVGEFKAVRQIVGLGFGGAQPPAGAHQSFQYIELTPAKFDIDPQTGQGVASFFDVFVDLNPFQGKRIKARLHFDSVDSSGNSGEGVYIDRVRISGAGAVEQDATVTALAQPVTVGGDTYVGEFQTAVVLADGINTIRARATQPYSPFNFGAAQVAGFLDARPPFVSLYGIQPVTRNLMQTLQGTVADATFRFMEVTQTNVFGERVLSTMSTLPPPPGTFSMPVFLAEGLNTFEAVASDGSGLQTTATLIIRADTTKPRIVRATVLAPVGEVSARPKDQVILDVETSDVGGSGVEEVLFYAPGDVEGQELIPAAEIPSAIRDRFQITGNFILFASVPPGSPPGTFPLTVEARDAAGNVSDRLTADVRIVPTLEQFNRYLMPGINFIATPLQCTGSRVSQGGLCSNDGDLSFDIAALLQQVVLNANPAFDPDGNPNTPVRLADVIETISAYDGGTSPANFKTYTTDANSDTLLKIQVLRGYVVKTRDGAFKRSEPIAQGFPRTPAPIKVTFIGSILRPGDLPPIQDVVGGWNLISLHSENSTLVERFLASVSVPERKWASLFTFVNALNFTPPEDPEDEPILEIILGAFKGKFVGDMFDPGDGAWLYMVQAGVLVPVLQ